MTILDPIVIVAAKRTAMGGFQGVFSEVGAPSLGAAAISAALAAAGVSPNDPEEVLMGCVLSAGLGQAPARQAALIAGMSKGVGANTINKMCGSGMQATIFGHDLLVAGSAKIAVVGGMESMTNAPYLLPKARGGYRMGHGQVMDHMFLDGLEDAYDKGKLMGTFAEDCAQTLQFSREAQDAYAIESLRRAKTAIEDGTFSAEITPVEIAGRKGNVTIDTDEQPGNARIDKIPQLKPAFRKDGTVTAANSSSISDGAAALVLMRASEAEKRGLQPFARIAGHANYGFEPGLFPTAPIGAMRRLADRTGWSMKQVDLFEINEAFAVVAMAAMQELDLPHDKVNVHGGACALGHPIGASGARILVTLLSALRKYGLQRGVASVCIGGGEASAVALELMT